MEIGLPAVTQGMLVIPGLGTGIHHRGEHGDPVRIRPFVLQDLGVAAGVLGDVRAEGLRHAPAGVEQVADILDVQAHLQGVADIARLHDEIVGEAEVEHVAERLVDRIGLRILALVRAQVGVLRGEFPVAGLIVPVDETDLALVGRDVHQVKCIGVAVHVVDIDVTVARIAEAFIEEAPVIVGGVGISDGGHEPVGQVIGRVVQDVIVGTVHRRDVQIGGRGVGTGHAGDFLAHGVRVGCRDAHVLQRLGVQGNGSD